MFREITWNRKQPNLVFFIPLSILVHLLICLILLGPVKKWALWEKTQKPLEPIQVEFLTKNQIAESMLIEKSEAAQKDAFLSAQDQIVDRQTKSKIGSTFKEGKVGGKAGRQTKEKAHEVKLSELGVHMNFKPLGNLGPNAPQGDSATTTDYLDDVKEGAQTLLNTKEFAFFSFYQRVRRQLEQYWEPGLRQKLRKMFNHGRQLAEDQQHSTRLLVVLNEEGTITKVQVEDTSGILDLDQAAVDAFNRAGPFPNPPKGMIEKDGTVKVEWEFILKT